MRIAAKRLWGPTGDRTIGSRLAAGRSQRRRDLSHEGPPFRWDEERRFQLRAEIDAAFFHLYGLSRDDVAYIIDTFSIVRRNDQSRFGESRTKRVIPEGFDELAGSPAVNQSDVGAPRP